MTSANAATMLNCGRPSQTASIAYPLLLLLMRRSSVVTVVWVPICRAWNRYVALCVQLMYPIPAFCAICCGVIPTRMCRVGARMIVAWALHSVWMWCRSSCIGMSWISFVERIRLVVLKFLTFCNFEINYK